MGASMTIVCPSCGARSDGAPAHLVGRTVRCPRCSSRFKVEAPGPGPTIPEADEPSPTAFEREPAVPVSATSASGRFTRERLTEWQVGDVLLDLYEVLGLLGEGGMGRVYRVRHRGWDMDLAAKVPRLAVLDLEGGADLFEREAETWVNLGLHPHTVTCFYVRSLQGVPVVFAEFVDGGSMHDRIRSRKLSRLDDMLDVAIQFAWGLHYAHEQGLVHLDVKPANVMITNDGLAKVTDFGLARARRRPQLTRAAGPILPARDGDTMNVDGAGGGTPAYMSPEQAAGRALTRRSDLWSWALSILEMFAGHRTWEWGVTGPDALEEHLVAQAPPGVAEMPDRVIDLLRRCFREDPEERPHTLLDAAAAVRDAYEAATGRLYPRREPRTGQRTPDGLNNRAVSLLDLGRDTEAASLWKGALEAEPQHVEATYNESLTGWTSGRIDDEEMQRRMGEARTTHAGVPRVHHLAGRLHLALGDAVHAIPCLEEAVRLGMASPDLDRDLGVALVAAAPGGDAKRSEERFEGLLQAGSTEAVDVVGYVLALKRLGQEDKALRFYEQAAAQNPDLPPELASALAAFLPGHQTIRSLKGLAGSATALAVSPDGSRVLAGHGLEVRVWDAATAAPARTSLRGDAPVRALAITPDGRFLLWAGENAAIQVWDLEAGRAVRTWQRHTGYATAIALAPDGRHAVTGGSDRTVRLWDIVTGQCLRTMEGHEDAVLSVVMGETRIVSGSRDGTVRVWDVGDGRCLGVLAGHKGRVSAVALSEAQSRLVSAGEDHTVREWGLNSFELVRVLSGHIQPVTSLALAPSGALVWSGALDSTVRAWDLDRERLHSLVRLDAAVHTLALGQGGLLWVGHGNSISALRPFERRLPPLALARPALAVEVEQHAESFEGRIDEARASFEAGDLRQAADFVRAARAIPGHERAETALALWDELCTRMPRKGLSAAWEEGKLDGHTDQVLAVAMSSDAARAFSAGMDQSVRVWDLAKRQVEAVLAGHEGAVTAVAASRDGRIAVSGSWDRTVRVWDLGTGRARRTLEGHEEYVTAVDVSPDGMRAVSGSWDQTVRLWRLGTGAPSVLAGHTSNVSAVAFGPDGRFVVSGGWDSTVRAWDVESGQAACLFEGHEGNVTAVAVSPNGRQVASGGQDAAVRLWDLRSRRCLLVLEGHEAEVTALAFTPDGRYVASSSRDQSVRVWDLEKGASARTLPHPAPVLGLTLSPSGNLLVSGGADRLLRIFHLDWEPGAPKVVAWDEGARPFLETFANARLKPESVRSAARPAVSDADVEALVADLRRRGFGSLRREAIAGKLKALAAEPPAPFWDEVRKSAPRVPAVRPAPVVETVVRTIPWRGIGLGLLALAGIAIGVSSWIKPKPILRVLPYMKQNVLKEIDPVDLATFTEPCSETYETYRDLSRAPETNPATLACLARTKQPATVTNFLAEAPLADAEDRPHDRRLFRNAVSLMLGLGEAAVEPLCAVLGDRREPVRRIAAVSLALRGALDATACLRATLAQEDPVARVSAASVLRWLLANGQVPAAEGYELVKQLARDPDPAIRIAATSAFLMFNADFAVPEVTALSSDPDPAVALAARNILGEIEVIRKVDLLRGGR